MATDLPNGYRPSDDEPFMNERQREYFRRKLVAWKEDILRESRETIQNLQSEPTPNADLADRATTESERQLELQDARPAAQTDFQDRRRAPASGRRLLRFLRGNRRADSPCAGWMRAPSPPSRSRRKSATSAASASTATTERHSPKRQRPGSRPAFSFFPMPVQNGQMMSKNCCP